MFREIAVRVSINDHAFKCKLFVRTACVFMPLYDHTCNFPSVTRYELGWFFNFECILAFFFSYLRSAVIDKILSEVIEDRLSLNCNYYDLSSDRL